MTASTPHRAYSGADDDTGPNAGRSGEASPRDLLFLALVSTILLMAVARTIVLWHTPWGTDDPTRSALLAPIDLGLVAVALLSLTIGGRPRLPRVLALRAALALAGILVVSFVVHPSWTGVEVLARMGAGVGVVRGISLLEPRRRVRFWQVVVGFAVAQAVLGVAQSIVGRDIGIPLLEYVGPRHVRGDLAAASGSFVHEYLLTTLLVLAGAVACRLLVDTDSSRGRNLLLGAVAVLAAGSTFTYGRTGLVAWAGLAVLAVVAWTPPLRLAAVAVVVGTACGSLLGISGWESRSAEVSQVGVATGRVGRVELAQDALAEHPLVGVGVGRYVTYLENRSDPDPAPPHNIVLQLGAEAGYPGLVLAAITLVLAGWWALFRRRITWLCGWALVPFVLIDHTPTSSPVGLLMGALWIALIVDVGATATEVP